jgi:hypothetical protein
LQWNEMPIFHGQSATVERDGLSRRNNFAWGISMQPFDEARKSDGMLHQFGQLHSSEHLIQLSNEYQQRQGITLVNLDAGKITELKFELFIMLPLGPQAVGQCFLYEPRIRTWVSRVRVSAGFRSASGCHRYHPRVVLSDPSLPNGPGAPGMQEKAHSAPPRVCLPP